MDCHLQFDSSSSCSKPGLTSEQIAADRLLAVCIELLPAQLLLLILLVIVLILVVDLLLKLVALWRGHVRHCAARCDLSKSIDGSQVAVTNATTTGLRSLEARSHDAAAFASVGCQRSASINWYATRQRARPRAGAWSLCSWRLIPVAVFVYRVGA